MTNRLCPGCFLEAVSQNKRGIEKGFIGGDPNSFSRSRKASSKQALSWAKVSVRCMTPKGSMSIHVVIEGFSCTLFEDVDGFGPEDGFEAEVSYGTQAISVHENRYRSRTNRPLKFFDFGGEFRFRKHFVSEFAATPKYGRGRTCALKGVSRQATKVPEVSATY